MKSDDDVALITPSYAADFERCRLLCDSIDKFVEGPPDHFILVDNDDYVQFSALGGPKRHIINEQDILPDWLRSIQPGIGKSMRKLWWSTRTWPMRGWHVQQLRRIAIAHHISHQGLLYCDSDMLFVQPFSPASLWKNGKLRMYRKPLGIDEKLVAERPDHYKWTAGAALINGLPEPELPSHDYINNLVSWRRDYIVEMCEHLEAMNDKHWVAAIGSSRTFSECQIFGAFCDGVKEGEGVWHAEHGLCQTYWTGEALNSQSMRTFVDGLGKGQVAVGIQSFTGTDPQILRQLISG